MTEQEWLASTDPAAMLRYITSDPGPYGPWQDPEAVRTGQLPRKLRLFACAVCRQVWDGEDCGNCLGRGEVTYFRTEIGLARREIRCSVCKGSGRVGGLTDPRSRRSVEVAERMADGLATREEADQANKDAERAAEGAGSAELWLAGWVADPYPLSEFRENIDWLERTNPGAPKAFADSLRCIVGNPWRPVVLAAGPVAAGSGAVCWPALLRWNGGTVPKIAAAIYEERAFDRLPILADALEEAGCGATSTTWNTGHEILAHCRGPGPHARGCWVIDLLLGKT